MSLLLRDSRNRLQLLVSRLRLHLLRLPVEGRSGGVRDVGNRRLSGLRLRLLRLRKHVRRWVELVDERRRRRHRFKGRLELLLRDLRDARVEVKVHLVCLSADMLSCLLL